MARRITSVTSLLPVAYADTVNLVNQNYFSIWQGGSATQINYFHEVSLSGQAVSSSSPTFMILSRDSTIGVTVGSVTTVDAPADPSTAALSAAVLVGNAWTTAPQRAA